MVGFTFFLFGLALLRFTTICVDEVPPPRSRPTAVSGRAGGYTVRSWLGFNVGGVSGDAGGREHNTHATGDTPARAVPCPHSTDLAVVYRLHVSVSRFVTPKGLKPYGTGYMAICAYTFLDFSFQRFRLFISKIQ